MTAAQASSLGKNRWWILAIAIAVLPFMISNGSLDIDEGTTAYRGSQPTPSAWLHNLIDDADGDSFQPLGMFFLWLTSKLIGSSEWQLRSVNLFWGALALFFIWRAGKNLDLEWLPLLFVIQPFFWFHTNEARPYAMQNACGSALLYAFTIFLRDQARGARWCIAFTTCAVVFCYATILAPFFLIPLVAVALIELRRNQWKLETKLFVILGAGLIVTIPAALYYLRVLQRQEAGAKIWAVDVRYLGYVVYELGGAFGLGPPLDNLRLFARNFSQFSNHSEIFLQLAFATLLLVLLGVVFLAPVFEKTGKRRRLVFILLTPPALEILILFGFGFALHKNFWPRHLNVAFPFCVAALGVAIALSFRNGNRLTKVAAVLAICLLIASSLRLRYSPMYAKEDYRWAVKAALGASRHDRVVWWVANKFTARYYGLDLVTGFPKSGEAFSPEQAHWKGVLSQPATPSLPNDIFVSRTDAHDIDGYVGRLIRENNYHLHATHPAFEWWIK